MAVEATPVWDAPSTASFGRVQVGNLTRMAVGFKRHQFASWEWLGPRRKPTGSPPARETPDSRVWVVPEPHLKRQDCGWVDRLITQFDCYEVAAFDHTNNAHIRLRSHRGSDKGDKPE